MHTDIHSIVRQIGCIGTIQVFSDHFQQFSGNYKGYAILFLILFTLLKDRLAVYWCPPPLPTKENTFFSKLATNLKDALFYFKQN